MERKLAAILAADVVGYSALMEADEAGTFERLRTGRKELFEPEVAKYHGRIFKLMGDGLLAEFGSVVDAVECAVMLQRGMAERNASVPDDKRFDIRIGINLGEVIVEGDDRYGEGVNVAARLQEIAEAGGICVSAKVSKEVERKLAFGFEPMGEQRIRNIAEPIACYRVNLRAGAAATAQSLPGPARPSDKAAIAVLPFVNMSSDPEQEYFADGLSEDLITDLSKIPGMMVIARNSSFAFKGRQTDTRSVARDLGVRYVVEGSVRRAAGRVRINAQLIDANDNIHLWADRFDRDLSDIFDLQDEIVGRIVNVLADVLPSARPVSKRRATNLQAYDLFVQGRILAPQSPESNAVGRGLLEAAIKLDPDFAEAHVWLALSYWFATSTWGEIVAENRARILELAERAVMLDPNEASAHSILGYLHLYGGDWDGARTSFGTALRINPNHADALMLSSDLVGFGGDPAGAIDSIRNAFRLNPHPPGWYYWVLGFYQYLAGRYEDAVETLKVEATYRAGSKRILAASLARLGRMDEARQEAGQFLVANPTFSAGRWAAAQPFRREADRAHIVEGYIMAGLPA